MKKFLAVLLAAIMVLSVTASFAESAEITDSTKVNTLIVGSPTLNGDFIDDFGNSSYDNWVKLLLMEYNGTMEQKARLMPRLLKISIVFFS